MNKAPPRNGKRFTVHTDVPAISTGKSSFVEVKPIMTIAEELMEKMKKKI
jgi:hypothetical protein